MDDTSRQQDHDLAGDGQLIRGLAAAVPRLRPLLAEHLADNFDEILPTLFLADVVRFMVAHSGESVTADGLQYLEQAFHGGDETRRTLISTGFIENLPLLDEPGSELRVALGPELRAEADRVFGPAEATSKFEI